jgi:release factor glutamine methyltransferase
MKVSDTPTLDAQTLLAHRLGKSRTWLLAHPEKNLSDSDLSSFQQELNDLGKGIPLPYVLGSWEFYGLSFTVTPDTLIPRPETELLVEKALGTIKLQQEPCLSIDIGTGCGCIAIALAKNNPSVTILATDISYPALKIARKNVIQHEVVDQVKLLQADLIPPISGHFDLICANLPYIPTQTLQNLDISGREPDLALDGGPKGLDFISKLFEEAKAYIAPGGILLIEIESSQGEKIQNLVLQAFPQADIELLPDLSGRDRLITIRQPGND